MPMRRQPIHPETKLPLYLQPDELARVQAVVRGALRVAFASSLAAAGCTQLTTQLGVADEHSDAGLTQAGSGGTQAPDAAGPTRGSEVDAATVDAADSGAGVAADSGVDAAADSGAVAAAGSGGPAATGVGPICVNGVAQLMKGLSPAEPFDYAAWRTVYSINATNGADVQSEGTACANSTDTTKCTQALAATETGLVLNDSCGQVGSCRHYIVTSHGDTVKRYATREELLTFLGPLDSPQDVLLLLHYDGFLLDCKQTLVLEEGDGYRVAVVQVTEICPVTQDLVQLQVSADGTVTELSREVIPQSVHVCVGRRPEGLVPQPARADTLIGAHFAAMAELEAASVQAFETLADELRAHGAPLRLIDAACEAARDEVRHAQRIGAIAQRYGATTTSPRIEPRPVRDLEALALDNAVEGCVRETFGAAVGCMQALSARDPEIARAMHEIAADETRHAALARELDAWLLPQLSDAGRVHVAAARAQAVSDLEVELSHEPDAALRELAGVPDTTQAALLHAVLRRELWNPARA